MQTSSSPFWFSSSTSGFNAISNTVQQSAGVGWGVGRGGVGWGGRTSLFYRLLAVVMYETWNFKKKSSLACGAAQLCLLPWPSFVSVSSFPANTGRGLLGSWGVGTRFQLHMLMYRNPLLGPCWGHRCTICIRTVKTQPVSNPFTDTGVAALPSKTFEKVTHASGSFQESLFHFVPALLRKNIHALSILHGRTVAFVVAALNHKQCLHYPHWPVLQSISPQKQPGFISKMTAYPGVYTFFFYVLHF